MIEHKPLYQAMISATSKTMEDMLFIAVMEHLDRGYEIPLDELVWTSLLINDPVQGEIRLAMPKTLLTKFTCNIFSMDEEEVTQPQMDDILNELLNTIAGLFMTNLLEDNQEYKIGLPELGVDEFPEVDSETIVWKLMTDDEEPIQIFVSGASLVALNES